MHSSRYRIVSLVFFPREDSLEKYRRYALLLLWSLTPLLRSFAGQVQAVVLVRNWQISLCCFVLDVLLAADCWLIISSSDFFFFGTLLLSSFWTSRDHRCRPSLPPPGYCLHFFLRIGFSTHWSSIFLSNVANSRSRAFRKSIGAQEKSREKIYEYALRGFELTKLTYTRLEDNLIRHRGSAWYRAGRPGGLVGLHYYYC